MKQPPRGMMVRTYPDQYIVVLAALAANLVHVQVHQGGDSQAQPDQHFVVGVAHDAQLVC